MFDDLDSGPELYEDDAENFERECLARDADLDREAARIEAEQEDLRQAEWEQQQQESPDEEMPF